MQLFRWSPMEHIVESLMEGTTGVPLEGTPWNYHGNT